MSLRPKGTPCNGPRGPLVAMSASACLAWRRARSKVRVMKARVWPSYCSTRWISASTSSTGESFRAAIRLPSSAIDRSCRSLPMSPPCLDGSALTPRRSCTGYRTASRRRGFSPVIRARSGRRDAPGARRSARGARARMLLHEAVGLLAARDVVPRGGETLHALAEYPHHEEGVVADVPADGQLLLGLEIRGVLAPHRLRVEEHVHDRLESWH